MYVGVGCFVLSYRSAAPSRNFPPPTNNTAHNTKKAFTRADIDRYQRDTPPASHRVRKDICNETADEGVYYDRDAHLAACRRVTSPSSSYNPTSMNTLRTPLAGALATALLLGTGSASAASISGGSITLYENGSALVTQTATATLPTGSTTLQLPTLDTIELDSLVLEGEGVTLESASRTNGDSYATILEKHIGKEVIAYPQSGEPIRGQLVLVSGNTVTIATDSGVRIVNYTSIEAVGADSSSLRNSPGISATLQSGSAARRALVLRYLANGLRWQAGYNATLNAEGTSLQLRPFATITNDTANTLSAMQVEMVSGQIQRANGGYYGPLYKAYDTAVESTAGNAGSSMPAEQAGDYSTYILPRSTTLAANGSTTVPLMQPVTLATTRDYTVQVPSDSDGKQTFFSQMRLTGTNGDRLLPPGVARVYGTQAGAFRLLGEAYLGRVAAGSTWELGLGQSNAVTATVKTSRTETTTQTPQTSDTKQILPVPSNRCERVTKTVTLRNRLETPATARLVESLWGNTSRVEGGLQWTEDSQNNYSATTQLAAGESKSFNYSTTQCWQG